MLDTLSFFALFVIIVGSVVLFKSFIEMDETVSETFAAVSSTYRETTLPKGVLEHLPISYPSAEEGEFLVGYDRVEEVEGSSTFVSMYAVFRTQSGDLIRRPAHATFYSGTFTVGVDVVRIRIDEDFFIQRFYKDKNLLEYVH